MKLKKKNEQHLVIDKKKLLDEQYLKNLRIKAMSWLSKINPDDWIKEIRGYSDDAEKINSDY